MDQNKVLIDIKPKPCPDHPGLKITCSAYTDCRRVGLCWYTRMHMHTFTRVQDKDVAGAK